MSNEEYVILGLKRFVATLFFKCTILGSVSNKDAIEMADELLKELD